MAVGKSVQNGAQARKQRRTEQRRKNRWTSALAGVGGLVLVVAALMALGKGTAAQADVRMAVIGQPMSDISLTNLEGQTVRLSDYAGRPVLVNAWATWCPPCKAEMPDLQVLYETYQDTGFTLLAVNAGDSPSAVESFITQRGFTFPVLLDPNSDTLQRLGVKSFPTSIFVGADGIVKVIHIGLYTPEAIQAELVPLLVGN